MTNAVAVERESDDRRQRSDIAEAIAEVMKSVRRLKKADNNAFAKYRYTSVDDFKDALRPLMADNGLTPHSNEVSFDHFERQDEKGKNSLHVKIKFDLWLEHVSGEREDPEGLTVALPYVGAQTSGQARSYAVKEWLKSKFLASSGDSEDADQHDTNEEMSKAEARALYTELQGELRIAVGKDRDAMEHWAATRRASIDVLPKDWRLQLKRQYGDGLATGRSAATSSEPEFDPAELFEALDAAMAGAHSPDEVEAAWVEFDVESVLDGRDDDRSIADKIKDRHLDRVQSVPA